VKDRTCGISDVSPMKSRAGSPVGRAISWPAICKLITPSVSRRALKASLQLFWLACT
jgi:hypothetical protein